MFLPTTARRDDTRRHEEIEDVSRSASPAEVAAATANAATHSLLTTTSEPTEWSSTGGGETTPVGPAARTPPLCGAHSTAARKTSSSIKAWMSLWQRPETQPSDETTSSLGAKKGGGVTSGDVSIQETNVPTDNSRDRQDLTNTETTEEPPTCATLGPGAYRFLGGSLQRNDSIDGGVSQNQPLDILAEADLVDDAPLVEAKVVRRRREVALVLGAMVVVAMVVGVTVAVVYQHRGVVPLPLLPTLAPTLSPT